MHDGGCEADEDDGGVAADQGVQPIQAVGHHPEHQKILQSSAATGLGAQRPLGRLFRGCGRKTDLWVRRG